jgi:D-sedoheptulose 7-phosphate isomerase
MNDKTSESGREAVLDARIKAHMAAMEELSRLRAGLIEAAGLLDECVGRGGKILVCGNGGSAAEAQHFATEYVGRYRSNRRSLPAIALSVDGTALTCIGNDFGWENIFARQIEAFASPGDLLFVLSTSGNSPNVLRALERARALNLKSVALLGKGGGQAGALADHAIALNSCDTGAIQEAHLLIIHFLCEGAESLL